MEHNIQTVIAPVGLGGKTAPYIADPAPTLLVELASVETERETARIAALLADAQRSATALVEEAKARASTLLEEASTTVADTLRAAEQEAESIRSEAEGRQVELDDLETTLNARTVAVDAEAAEAASILAGARTDAEAILAEAHSGADAILAEAKEQARLVADSAAADMQATEEAADAIASRVAEIESVHRIEVQVLHERETELLARIGYLESQLQGAKHAEEDAEPAPDAAADSVAPSTVSVHLDSLTPPAEDSRANGRHNGDARVAEYASSGPLTTHAPLTEQLSTSAFRASPEPDRRGRRRR